MSVTSDHESGLVIGQVPPSPLGSHAKCQITNSLCKVLSRCGNILFEGSQTSTRRCPLERQEFDQLHDAHYVRVVRFVQRRVRDVGHAEDIAADTFLVAWAKLTTDEGAVPWLYGTARNKIKQYYHHVARDRDAEARIADEQLVASMGLGHLDRMIVREAVASLSGKQREVIMLTYWEDMSAAEVATVLDCSARSVWTALTRGRTKLRELLADLSPVLAGDRDG